MAFFRTTSRDSTDWQQRLTLASEFELSMAGFGLMGDPGHVAERVLLSDLPSAWDVDHLTTNDRPPLPALPCGAQA